IPPFAPGETAITNQQPSLFTRRQMLHGSGMLVAAAAAPSALFAAPAAVSSRNHRPIPSKRHFVSPAIEEAITRTKKQIADPQLAAIFENCFPNTLDTTVFP